MKTLQELTKEISSLTLKIEQEYPELYQYLDENPITICNIQHPKMTIKVMHQYLDALKQLLEHYILSHKKAA